MSGKWGGAPKETRKFVYLPPAAAKDVRDSRLKEFEAVSISRNASGDPCRKQEAKFASLQATAFLAETDQKASKARSELTEKQVAVQAAQRRVDDAMGAIKKVEGEAVAIEVGAIVPSCPL